MFSLKITPDSGDSYTLTADSRDIYRWEKAGKNRSVGELGNSVSMTAMYEISHVAAQRQGKFNGSLDDFVNTHQIVFEAEVEEDPKSSNEEA